VNGVFLGTAYPVRYADIEFPVMPGGVLACESCHGAGSSTWKQPAERDHPLLGIAPVQEWSAACGSCHDSAAAAAHIQAMTQNGQEGCAVCHGPGKEWDAELRHRKN
jgi:predicted CXXCH cytochrome family protein